MCHSLSDVLNNDQNFKAFKSIRASTVDTEHMVLRAPGDVPFYYMKL